MPRTIRIDPALRHETESQYLARCLATLIGCTITESGTDAAGNPALVLEDDTHHIHYLSITRDAEGNGPGWVDIDFARPSPAYEAYLELSQKERTAYDAADTPRTTAGLTLLDTHCTTCGQDVQENELEAHLRTCNNG